VIFVLGPHTTVRQTESKAKTDPNDKQQTKRLGSKPNSGRTINQALFQPPMSRGDLSRSWVIGLPDLLTEAIREARLPVVLSAAFLASAGLTPWLTGVETRYPPSPREDSPRGEPGEPEYPGALSPPRTGAGYAGGNSFGGDRPGIKVARKLPWCSLVFFFSAKGGPGELLAT